MKEQELAVELFNIGAIKFGEFKLKLHEKNPDAPLSPIYIDLRVLRSSPGTLEHAVFALARLVRELRFDYLADVPTAATPIVAVLSNKMRVPMISPRLTDKTHGIKGKIDGIFVPGGDVLLIDDLITTADSKFEAIITLEEHALLVHDVVVLVDREQGGTEALYTQGYYCHAVFKLSELLTLYRERSLIDADTHKRVVDYLQQ